MKRIVLHIDRLVLRGFPHAQHAALVEGMREALARHYAEPDAAGPLGRMPARQERVSAGRVALRDGLPAGAIGERLGRGIAGGLGR